MLNLHQNNSKQIFVECSQILFAWHVKADLRPGTDNRCEYGDLERNPIYDSIVFHTAVTDSTLILYSTLTAREERAHLAPYVDFRILDKDNINIKTLESENCGKTSGLIWNNKAEIPKEFINNNIDSVLRPGNYLRILCVIDFGCSMSLRVREVNQSTKRADFEKDFENLYHSNKFRDVKIIAADGKELQAHKTVLIARSPVFSSYFENDTREKQQNVIEISDIESHVIEGGLKYIYSNKFDGLSKIAGELMYFADKYDIKGLRIECGAAVANDLNIENAIQSLILADSR